MNRYPLNLSFSSFRLLLCLGLLSLSFYSCHRQVNQNLTEAKPLPEIEIQPAQNSNWLTDQLYFLDGQLCAWVRNIHQDKKGHLWFASNHLGMMRYDGDTLEYFDEEAGLGGGRVTDIVADEQGHFWVGTASGLSRYNGESFTNLGKEDGLPQPEIWSLMRDNKGIIWIGTMEGVYHFDGKNFSPFPLPKIIVKDTNTILSHNRMGCMMQDSKGVVWMGLDGLGILKYDPAAKDQADAFTTISKKDGLCDNNISYILEDKNGNVWISTMFGGISKYDGKTFHNYTLDGEIKGVEVSRIYEDKNGDIWFAAEHNGIYRYDGKSFQHYDKNDGLETGGMLCMMKDKEDRFWFGGWGGLFRFDGERFASVTKDGPWD